ncbi:DUF5681 domain-containing protein [Erythrobacter sp.]|uniref:DUF5681 domain-containing protein n=1 Tax=Erythrobacter sp. TaxID=1042 RepID=UPI003C7319D5
MTDNSANRNGDPREEVGYGKPPRHTRWKKGQSGNPKGRPKGARSLKVDLDRVLRKILTIEGKGTKFQGTTQSLALEMLARRAATGDIRASKALIELTLTIFGPGDRGGERESLSAHDQQLLDSWMSSLAAGNTEALDTIRNESQSEQSLQQEGETDHEHDA